MIDSSKCILHIDLTNKKIWKEILDDEIIAKYLGCRGVNVKLLWDLVKPNVDPLGCENVLIFGTGLLTGTSAPCSGRTTVTTLSPATGIYLKTNAGGEWASELKFAGYGYVVIHGKSDKPVYVCIENDKVEIKDASHLWGMDVRTADIKLKEELGDNEIQTAMIGPAGENLVKFASVMFSIYSAAARGGAGAVMGSKNLKCIVVRGTGSVSVKNPKEFQKYVNESKKALFNDSGYEEMHLYGTASSIKELNEINLLPAYNFKQSSSKDVTKLTGQYLIKSGYLKKRVGCFGCVIGCHRYTTVDKGKYSGSFSGGPEYETISSFGTGCGIFEIEPVLKANELCNIYGMDVISAGTVIQWAMECYSKGLINKDNLNGLELEWGNADAMIIMLEKLAYRRDFGNILAEGVKKASEVIGGDSYKWAVHGKGLEQSRIETRGAKAYALAFAVNPRGADHLHTQTLAEFGIGPESVDLIEEITGDKKYAVPDTIEKRAEIVRWHEDCYSVTDALGICTFATSSCYGVTPKMMAQLFSTATGFNINEEEIMLAGRRILTLEKCYNVRLGLDRKDDVLPWRIMNEKTAPKGDLPRNVTTKEELDIMLDEYYKLHGWNIDNGIPKRSTLLMLDLEDVADELEKIHRL